MIYKQSKGKMPSNTFKIVIEDKAIGLGEGWRTLSSITTLTVNTKFSYVPLSVGGAMGKRSRTDMGYDTTPKADDHVFIIGLLNYEPKRTLRDFLVSLTPDRRTQLYQNIMPQKNGDRVLKCFVNELGLVQKLEEPTNEIIKTIK